MDTQTLSDRAEIADLISRLGRWLDEHRFDEAPSLFTEDATVATPGGIARGRDALVAQARRNHEAVTTQHVITNCVVELDGSCATAGANLVVTFVPRGEEPRPRFQLGERYAFDAVRTPAGWRLAGVRTTLLWSTGDAPAAPSVTGPR